MFTFCLVKFVFIRTVLHKHIRVLTYFVFCCCCCCRELEACCHLLASLCSCLEQIMIIREKSEHGSLFPPGEHKAIGLFNTSASVNQYSFYGRCIGFHVSVNVCFIKLYAVLFFSLDKMSIFISVGMKSGQFSLFNRFDCETFYNRYFEIGQYENE